MTDGLPLNLAILAMNPKYRDERVQRTIAFFINKGFVAGRTTWWRRHQRQLTLDDVLWSCDAVVPEFFAVLPTVLIRYPKHLSGEPPEDLRVVIDLLRAGATDGPGYKGHAYWVLLAWADHLPRNSRIAKELVRRVSYQVPVRILAGVEALARRTRRTRTQVVVDALEVLLANKT